MKTGKRNPSTRPCLSFQVPHWTTRLATVSDPSVFHWNFLVKFYFLWGHDLTKSTLQVFVSMESLKLLFIIATTHEPGFGILCMLISSSVCSMTKSGGNAAVCRLETCSKRKPWFCWEEIFFFFQTKSTKWILSTLTLL